MGLSEPDAVVTVVAKILGVEAIAMWRSEPP
jgi:hypothetical protein